MLSDSLLTAYREDGFIVIPDVFSAAEVTELRRVTDQFVGDAAQVSANDEVYDLEDTHSTAEPRVRRIKTPHLHHTAYAGTRPSSESWRICGAACASTPGS